MIEVTLLTEDELSAAVADCLLKELGIRFSCHHIRRGGFGYIRKKMDSWCQLAHYQAVFILTDLDNKECPLALINEWFGAKKLSEKLLFRIAVREVEAWLMADHSFMQNLIGQRGRLSQIPESLLDPKQALLELVNKYARREIRYDVVKKEGNNLRQGINYNSRLINIVRHSWNPERAAELSPSLKRARIRMREWASKLQ